MADELISYDVFNLLYYNLQLKRNIAPHDSI